MRVASTCTPPMLLDSQVATQDYDYDEPYVEREHKLQPHLDILSYLGKSMFQLARSRLSQAMN